MGPEHSAGAPQDRDGSLPLSVARRRARRGRRRHRGPIPADALHRAGQRRHGAGRGEAAAGGRTGEGGVDDPGAGSPEGVCKHLLHRADCPEWFLRFMDIEPVPTELRQQVRIIEVCVPIEEVQDREVESAAEAEQEIDAGLPAPGFPGRDQALCDTRAVRERSLGPASPGAFLFQSSGEGVRHEATAATSNEFINRKRDEKSRMRLAARTEILTRTTTGPPRRAAPSITSIS